MQTLFTKYYLTMQSLSCLYPLGFYEELTTQKCESGKGLHGGPYRTLGPAGDVHLQARAGSSPGYIIQNNTHLNMQLDNKMYNI